MIVVQIMKVLPPGSKFEIIDCNKTVLEGYTSTVEKLPVFETVDDDILYLNVYSTFHVDLIDKVGELWKITTR